MILGSSFPVIPIFDWIINTILYLPIFDFYFHQRLQPWYQRLQGYKPSFSGWLLGARQNLRNVGAEDIVFQDELDRRSTRPIEQDQDLYNIGDQTIYSDFKVWQPKSGQWDKIHRAGIVVLKEIYAQDVI